MAVPKRFGILRLVGTLLKVIAWIILVVAVIAAIVVAIAGSAPALQPIVESLVGIFAPGVAFDPSSGSGIIIGIITLILGLLYFILFYAGGENILLRVALEENTRLTAALLLRMHQDSQLEAEPDFGGGYGSESYQR